MSMALHVIDTTALSNFTLIERPELIQIALRGEGVTTAVVLTELKVGESLGLIPACDWSRLPVVQLTPAEDSLYEKLRRVLGDGEASYLAVAMTRQAVLVTDDRQARRLAVEGEIWVSGTIGLLLMLIRDGHLVPLEGNAMLSEMIAHGYRSPVRDLLALLE